MRTAAKPYPCCIAGLGSGKRDVPGQIQNASQRAARLHGRRCKREICGPIVLGWRFALGKSLFCGHPCRRVHVDMANSFSKCFWKTKNAREGFWKQRCHRQPVCRQPGWKTTFLFPEGSSVCAELGFSCKDETNPIQCSGLLPSVFGGTPLSKKRSIIEHAGSRRSGIACLRYPFFYNCVQAKALVPDQWIQRRVTDTLFGIP